MVTSGAMIGVVLRMLPSDAAVQENTPFPLYNSTCQNLVSSNFLLRHVHHGATVGFQPAVNRLVMVSVYL